MPIDKQFFYGILPICLFEEHCSKKIEALLSIQNSICEINCDIDVLASNFTEKIISRKQDENDYRSVDINSLEMSRSKSVGCEHVTIEALHTLGLDHKLKKLGFSWPQVSLAIGAIIGRACHPGSELATHENYRILYFVIANLD